MIGLRELLLRSRELLRGKVASLDPQRRGKPILHFIHLGKTGGTAIKHALSGHESAGKFHIVLHEHDFTLGMVPKSEFAFFVLRDPIERFRSGFASRQTQGQPRYHYSWNQGEKDAFAQFADAEELALAIGCSNKARREDAAKAMRSIRHVRDSYVRMLGTPAQVRQRKERIAYICFQSRLHEDFRRFCVFAALPSNLQLPVGPVEAHRSNEGATRSSLSQSAIDNLSAWYAQDLEIYATFLKANELTTQIPPGTD